MIMKVTWVYPPRVWIKANFDGVAKGNLGPASSGGVLRDHYGNFVLAVVLPLGSQSNHFVEAIGAFLVIDIASKLNIKNIWIEGNSKNIIECLLGNFPPSWKIKIWIDKARSLINNFDDVRISCVSGRKRGR